jgi:hypothetical protein
MQSANVMTVRGVDGHAKAKVEVTTRKSFGFSHAGDPKRDTIWWRLSARTRPASNTTHADAVPWHSGKRRNLAHDRFFEYHLLPDQRSGGELTAKSQVTTRREAQTVALGGLSTHLR